MLGVLLQMRLTIWSAWMARSESSFFAFSSFSFSRPLKNSIASFSNCALRAKSASFSCRSRDLIILFYRRISTQARGGNCVFQEAMNIHVSPETLFLLSPSSPVSRVPFSTVGHSLQHVVERQFQYTHPLSGSDSFPLQVRDVLHVLTDLHVL